MHTGQINTAEVEYSSQFDGGKEVIMNTTHDTYATAGDLYSLQRAVHERV